MDNMLQLKSDVKMTETYFTGAKRQLFINDFDHDLSKYDMDDIVPLPIQKYDKHANSLNTAENISKDDDVGQESDEFDYDSDCSLGSMNSLYLSLKEGPNHLYLNESNEINMVQLKNENSILNEVHKISEYKIVLKNQILEKQKGCKIDIKSEKKLNTTIFYGKKTSVIQQFSSCLPYARQLKKKCLRSKLRKTKTSVFKFQRSINKLRLSLKHQKHRNFLKFQRVSTNKKMQTISNKNPKSNQLQETFPFLQFSCHKAKKNTQNSEEYFQTNTVVKNEIDFDILEMIKKEEYSIYEDNFENQMFESNIEIKQEFITTDDFKDFDSFEDNLVVEDIINRLCDES